jgi:hypothetical protein
MSSFARLGVAGVFGLMGLAGLTASPAAALPAGPEADHDPWIVRVYFALDDNNDKSADYIGYYSGDNRTSANRPQLVVTYQ